MIAVDKKLDPLKKEYYRPVSKGKYVSALFMDLSKAFDTINHDLLFVKLKAYRFSLKAVKLMHSCLKNRTQQFQIDNKFSSETLLGLHKAL